MGIHKNREYFTNPVWQREPGLQTRSALDACSPRQESSASLSRRDVLKFSAAAAVSIPAMASAATGQPGMEEESFSAEEMAAMQASQDEGFSPAEYQRRWAKAREYMRAEKIDYLVMRNAEEYFGGNVRWFFDGDFLTPLTIIFPVDEDLILIGHGASGGEVPIDFPGVSKLLEAPYVTSLPYSASYDAELAVKILKGKRKPKIGLVGQSQMPMTFYEHLRKNLRGARFVDATDGIDRIRAIKSPEEQQHLIRAAHMQDAVVEDIRRAIKPGVTAQELEAVARRSAFIRGSKAGFLNLGIIPENGDFMTPKTVVEEGDQVMTLIAKTGTSNLFNELGRTYSVGKPSQQLVDSHALAMEFHQFTVDLLKPGNRAKDIWDAYNDKLQKHGFPPEARLFAHGSGYDVVERPAIRFDEPMTLQAGMNFIIPITLWNEAGGAGVVDNYLVTKGDAKALHKTQREIIVV